MKRTCPDCGKPFTCSASRIAAECHDCYETLKQIGFANVRQPKDPTLYNPRYNGIEATGILDDDA